MKSKIAGVALAAVMACGWAGGAQAAYIINFDQVGNDVVVSGSGSLDLSGATYRDTRNDGFSGGFSASTGAIALGVGPQYDEYYGLTSKTTFGFGTFGASNTKGDYVGFATDLTRPIFFVPAGYVSGNYLQSSDTFLNTDLRKLGVTRGTYTYSFGSDEFVVNISVVPAPLPASAPMFGAALVIVGALGSARRGVITARARRMA